MQFEPYGRFEVPRKRDTNHVDMSKQAKAKFWAKVEEVDPGLSKACGCYLFAISASGAIKPWYVGKAEKGFKQEVFTPTKLGHYNEVLARPHGRPTRGVPIVFLLARVTPKEKFCKPSRHPRRDVDFLEAVLIGMALRRNKGLRNVAGTQLLRDLTVRGFINV